MRKIRLMIQQKILRPNINVNVAGQDFDYLVKVMRVKTNDKIEVFNGQDGDFLSTISQIDKKALTLTIDRKIKDQDLPSNISLAFAPVKNVKTQFIAQKSVELNVSKIIPIITTRTIVKSINSEKLIVTIKESCEQCEANHIASLSLVTKLDNLLNQDEISDKILILCDESGNGKKASEILPQIAKNRQNNQEIIIFVGPEGGFSAQEFEKFYELKNLTSISLGKNTLRADTAIISALTLVGEYF